MVHSGSTSPMTTTTTSSPHLTVPPMQTIPPGDQNSNRTSDKLLKADLASNLDSPKPSTLSPVATEPLVITPAKDFATNPIPTPPRSSTKTLNTDLTSNSDSTEPSTLAPTISESLVLNPAIGLTSNSNTIPSESYAKTLNSDFTSNLDSTKPSSLTASATEPLVITPAKELVTNISPTPSRSSTNTLNGRTSGRKRTPKACDCCGPNGKGHDVGVRTYGRGRGRGRGKGKAANGELCDTPKRKATGDGDEQLTRNKRLDLTEEKEKEEEDANMKDEQNGFEKAKTDIVAASTQLQTTEGPMRDPGELLKTVCMQTKADILTETLEVSSEVDNESSLDLEKRLSGFSGRGRGSPVVRGRGRGIVSGSKMEAQSGPTRNSAATTEEHKGASSDLNTRLLGVARRARPLVRGRGSERGRGMVGAASVSKFEDEIGPITNSVAAVAKVDVQKKDETLTEGLEISSQGKKAAAGGGHSNFEIRISGISGRGSPISKGRGMVRAAPVSKPEVESPMRGRFFIPKTYSLLPRVLSAPTQNKVATVHHEELADSAESPIGNGDTVDLSDSEHEDDDNKMVTGGMENGLLHDVESEMLVDQNTPHRTETDSVSYHGTLSNGNVTTPTKDTLTNAATSHQATVFAPPLSEVPISLLSTEHRWALRDHQLYCHTGTWDKTNHEEMDEESGKDRSPQREELREQLINMVHEFLESFYLKYGGFIPLSDTDVLEHLKNKGHSDLSNSGLDMKAEVSRYRAALACAPIAGFTVAHNKHTLSLDDLGTLEDHNWLNDQIINMYGELIMEATQQKVHFFNSFFHKQLVAKGYEGVKRWTKKVDLFSKWLLLIPIHLEIHWSLIAVTMATKTISYYDSQGIVFRHTTDNIMKYLLSEAREKKLTAFQKGWKITIIKGIPQQKNDSDCGVFVLEYCRCLSVKQPMAFCQDDMPCIRKRVYKELCDRVLDTQSREGLQAAV